MEYSIPKKQILIACSSVLMCSLTGEEYNCREVDGCCQQCATTIDCPPEDCGYNTAVLFNPCACTDLYVTGTFLYWRASGNYLTEAFLDTSFSSDPNSPLNFVFTGSSIDPVFEYNPGFSVGLGYKFGCDQWDLYGEYTRFHSTVNSSTQAILGDEVLHAAWLTFVIPVLLADEFQSVSSTWTIDLDFVDAELGRNFFLGRSLTFRPSLGLRFLWLLQKYDLWYISLRDEIPIDSFNQSDSWSIGPRFHLHNDWNVCGGFKLFGDLGISVLHTRDNTNVEQVNHALENNIPNNVTYKNTQALVTIKPILDLSIGAGWGGSFWCDKLYFDLSVSYDHSVYYNQSSIQLGHAPLVVPGQPIQILVGGVSTGNSNLSIEGLNVTLRLDF